VITARSLPTFVRPPDLRPCGRCSSSHLWTIDQRRFGLLNAVRAALPSAYLALVRANEHPCERRRLSPTWLYPKS
jgi:hypothetical protein